MSLEKPSLQLRYFRHQQPRILDTLEQLVEIESPSDIKAAVDRLGTVVASRFQELGGKPRWHPTEKVGNHLEIRFTASVGRGEKPWLILGHLDTVYPIGTILKMPYRVSKGRVWGPG
ncbi:MAG: M20 family peptidase, partial [Acidobacteria bacterium]|nr:M20 family peptidase [Acidobacteriota bacterium]